MASWAPADAFGDGPAAGSSGGSGSSGSAGVSPEPAWLASVRRAVSEAVRSADPASRVVVVVVGGPAVPGSAGSAGSTGPTLACACPLPGHLDLAGGHPAVTTAGLEHLVTLHFADRPTLRKRRRPEDEPADELTAQAVLLGARREEARRVLDRARTALHQLAEDIVCAVEEGEHVMAHLLVRLRSSARVNWPAAVYRASAVAATQVGSGTAVGWPTVDAWLAGLGTRVRWTADQVADAAGELVYRTRTDLVARSIRPGGQGVPLETILRLLHVSLPLRATLDLRPDARLAEFARAHRLATGKLAPLGDPDLAELARIQAIGDPAVRTASVRQLLDRETGHRRVAWALLLGELLAGAALTEGGLLENLVNDVRLGRPAAAGLIALLTCVCLQCDGRVASLDPTAVHSPEAMLVRLLTLGHLVRSAPAVRDALAAAGLDAPLADLVAVRLANVCRDPLPVPTPEFLATPGLRPPTDWLPVLLSRIPDQDPWPRALALRQPVRQADLGATVRLLITNVALLLDDTSKARGSIQCERARAAAVQELATAVARMLHQDLYAEGSRRTQGDDLEPAEHYIQRAVEDSPELRAVKGRQWWDRAILPAMILHHAFASVHLGPERVLAKLARTASAVVHLTGGLCTVQAVDLLRLLHVAPVPLFRDRQRQTTSDLLQVLSLDPAASQQLAAASLPLASSLQVPSGSVGRPPVDPCSAHVLDRLHLLLHQAVHG